MNIFNLFNSRLVKNATQVNDSYNARVNLNSVGANITDYIGGAWNGENGKYDNHYADVNRIILEAPIHEFYYTIDDSRVDTGNVAEVLKTPNDNYSQYKFLQQVYTEILSRGYVDLKFWHIENGKETFHLNGKQNENNISGITLITSEDKSRDSAFDRQHYLRITYGANQSNVFLGYSPTQAAENWRKMVDAMGLHMTAFAKNAGMPIGKFVITAPSVEEFKKITSNLSKKIDGNKNNGKVLYDYRPADTGVSQIDWIQFTSKQAQDYSKSLEFAEKQMSQNFGVPSIIKGSGGDANYATARVSEYIFMRYTITGLVRDVLSQFNHILRVNFGVEGEIKTNIELPELADETLVKVQATREQLELFERKVAEGYEPRSIVKALELPERFLLLEKVSDTENNLKSNLGDARGVNRVENKPVSAVDAVSDEEMELLENDYKMYALEYARNLEIDEAEAELAFMNSMTTRFAVAKSYIYSEVVGTMTTNLLDSFETIDMEQFALNDDELEVAVEKYKERVAIFSKNFKESLEGLDSGSVEFKKTAESNAERIAITEAEHVKITSQLEAWTKAEKELPIRVFKKWKARATACELCRELHNVEVDVSSDFKVNEGVDAEFSEIKAGSAHPRCHCIVYYEYERIDV